MSLQVVISTIDNNIENINPKTLQYNNLIIINQKTKIELSVDKEERYKESIFNNVKWIDVLDKGLSRSRNLGLSLTNSEYLYLTDDDIILNTDFSKVVLQSFKDNPEADVLAFNVEGIKKRKKKKNISLLNSFKLSSVQLVFRVSFIKKNRLKFDERFGAGAEFKMGEENIFLVDLLKAKAKIIYIPKTIATLESSQSTWFEGYNNKYFIDRGAIFARMFGFSLGVLFSLQFCIRKFRLYSQSISFKDALRMSVYGVNLFSKNDKKSIEI